MLGYGTGGSLKRLEVGDCVYIEHYPDHSRKLRLSGCPTWRPAVGVLIEKLYEYDGSQIRMIVLVEGREQYFMNYQVKQLEDK